MVNKIEDQKETSLLWEQIDLQVRCTLSKFVDMWIEEDSDVRSEVDVFRRLHEVLECSDHYVMVFDRLAIADPIAARVFLRLSQGGSSDTITAYKQKPYAEFMNLDNRCSSSLAQTINDTKKEVSLKQCSVDCQKLIKAFACFNNTRNMEAPPPAFVTDIAGVGYDLPDVGASNPSLTIESTILSENRDTQLKSEKHNVQEEKDVDIKAFLPKSEHHRQRVITMCRGAKIALESDLEFCTKNGKLSADAIASLALDNDFKWLEGGEDRVSPSSRRFAGWIRKWLKAGQPDPEDLDRNHIYHSKK